MEQLTERFGGPAASAYATRSGGPAGVVPGGMQVVPYTPQPAGGQWGHPDNTRRHAQAQRPPTNAYGVPYNQGHPVQQHQSPQAAMHYAGSPRGGYAGAGPQVPQPYGQQQAQPHAAAPQQMGAAMPGQALTQQIYIPNDMVGAIIGKGGAKINEIRQLSGSVIKINEPQDNSNERLVTITGTQDCNQMALYMLYQRLGQFDGTCFNHILLTTIQKVRNTVSKSHEESSRQKQVHQRDCTNKIVMFLMYNNSKHHCLIKFNRIPYDATLISRTV